jgi:hypothetical protein
MINKSCSDHPDCPPLILDSGNQTHVSCARCAECDRFLGWVGRADLVAHIKELELEVNRLKAIFNLASLKVKGGK